MGSFTVNIKDIKEFASNWPNGPYLAKVLEATVDVAKTPPHNPVIRLKLELYDPVLGTCLLNHNLASAFAAQVRSFYMAYHDLTLEEMAGVEEIELEASDLVGAQFIVQLGEKKSKTDGNTYKQIVSPWFYPVSRHEDLLGNEETELG